MHTTTDTASAIQAGLMMSNPRLVAEGGAPFVVRPSDSTLESVEEYLPNPTRLKQRVRFHDGESFIAYVNRFREVGTTIFFNEPRKSFTAVLDYHEGNGPTVVEETETSMQLSPAPSPRWCEHIADFTPRTTPEWDAWMAMNTRKVDQTTFAEFLENHIDDVASSYGATLLKIALTLEIKNSVAFTSHQKLEDGSVKLVYEEDVQGTASNGLITIPPSFKLEIQPFAGGPMYAVDCKFRYRLTGRAVTFWFEIVQLEKLIETALSSIRKTITEATGVFSLAGEYLG